MKKLIFAIIILSGFMYFTLAQAEEKLYTPQEVVESFAAVPGKVANHISMEIEKTKAYQADSWAEVKFRWMGFKEKFLSN